MIQSYSLILTFVATFFFRCSGYGQVNSSFDSGAKFGKYTTYSFLGWQNRSNENLSLEDQKTILESFKNEFGRRGVEWIKGKGSAVISIHVVIDEKTAKAEYADYLHQYGYKAVWETEFGNEADTTLPEVAEVTYRQGTLIVHMYDSETNELVWQAVVTDVLQAEATVRTESIPKHIAELMKSYPIQAR